MPTNLIHVWYENQRTPATAYGNAKYGSENYEIIVSADAAKAQEEMGGIVYHYTGSGSGGGGGGRR